MIILLIIVSILLVIFCILYFIQRYEAKQLVNENEIYEQWFNTISSSVRAAYTEMESIDKQGMFESDDVVGSIFKQLKNIIKSLDNMVGGING